MFEMDLLKAPQPEKEVQLLDVIVAYKKEGYGTKKDDDKSAFLVCTDKHNGVAVELRSLPYFYVCGRYNSIEDLRADVRQGFFQNIHSGAINIVEIIPSENIRISRIK